MTNTSEMKDKVFNSYKEQFGLYSDEQAKNLKIEIDGFFATVKDGAQWFYCKLSKVGVKKNSWRQDFS